MKRLFLAVTLAFIALPCLASAQEGAEVQVRQASANGYELRVVLPAAVSEAQAQASLLPVARQVCGGRSAQLGRYRFESTRLLAPAASDPGTQAFIQQVECGAPAAAASEPPGQPAPRTPPTDDDKRRVTERTLAYLAAKDRGDFAAAREFFEPGAASMLASPEGEQRRRSFNKAAGQPAQRQVVRLTWYDDPEGAPRRGRYAAADYRADYPHAGFYCGFAMWWLQPDGEFRIVRIEEGEILDADAKAIAPGQLASVRAQLGCRD